MAAVATAIMNLAGGKVKQALMRIGRQAINTEQEENSMLNIKLVSWALEPQACRRILDRRLTVHRRGL